MADQDLPPTEQEVSEALNVPEEQPELKDLSDEERVIALRLIPQLTLKIKAQCDARATADYAQKIDTVIQQLISENKTMMDTKVEELRKSMTPPTPDELQKLLAQEYAEFSVKLRCGRKGDDNREFVIRELPIAAESRFIKAVKKTIIERVKEITAIQWSEGTNSTAERLMKIIEIVPGALETLSDVTAICLDPYGDNKDIDGAWVQSNMSVVRMSAILQAQMEVGKYRDFLLQASRFIPTTMTM